MKIHHLCNLCPPPKSPAFGGAGVKSVVSGSALMITAVVVMTMVVISGVLLNDVVIHTKLVNAYENNYLLRYAADSGLEQVKYQAKTSAYTGTRNVWLMSNSSTAGTLAINALMINNIPVDITLYDLSNGWYRAVSTANKNYDSYRVAVDIRESSIVNSIFNYAYASAGIIYGGDMNLRPGVLANAIYGDVHTNGQAVFGRKLSNGGVAVATQYGIPVYGNVTAVNGVGTWIDIGGTPDKYWAEGDLVGGSVSGTIDGHVSPVAFPGVDTFTNNLQASADDYPEYFIHWSNPLYAPYEASPGDGFFATEITLITTPGTPTQIKIEFMNITVPGTPIHTVTLPLPDHKLLWIDGVTRVKGEINGRLTIATPSPCLGIYVNGNIRYIDDQGDRAYVLKKNGVVVDPDSTGTEAWTAANGYTYEVNPAYNPTVPANLTLQTMWAGLDGTNMPYNLEVQATVLSWYWNFRTSASNRGNFRMVGSVVPVSGVNSASSNIYKLSSDLISDSNLRTNAPEWYPTSGGNSSNIPAFFAWRRY
ncbi:MAG: hypothetical protein AAB019_05480 [Planctomycetota bacterium]